MAAGKSVLKLTVDDKEYGQKLKEAMQGMRDLQQSLGQSGQTFATVGQNAVDYARSIGKMEGSAKNSRGAMRELSQTLTEMTVQYRAMTDEERSSKFGQAMAQSIGELTERAGELRDAMADTEAAIAHAASDTRTFDQVAGAAQMATSAFSTLQGSAKMLGLDLGDNVEVLTRLQAATSVVTSLQQMQNLVQKQSALMMGIATLQAKAAAAAQQQLGEQTAAATAKQRIFNMVAKANPYTLLAVGVAAVIGGLRLFGSSTDDATTATDTLKQKVDELNQTLNRTVTLAQTLGQSTAQINAMREQAAKAEVEMAQAEKNKWGALYRQFGDGFKQPYDKAVDAEIEARKKLAAILADNAATRQAELRIFNNYQNLQTTKEMQAAVALLQRMQSETRAGSEEWQRYGQMIATVQANLAKWQKTGGATTPTATTSTGATTTTPIIEQPVVLTVGTSGMNQANIDAWTAMMRDRLNQAEIGSTVYQSIMRSMQDMSQFTDLIKKAAEEGVKLQPEAIETIFDQIFNEQNMPEEWIDNLAKTIGRRVQEETSNATGKGEGKATDNKKKKNADDKEEKAQTLTIDNLRTIASSTSQLVSGIESLGMEVPKGFKQVVTIANAVLGIITAVQSLVTVIAVRKMIPLPGMQFGGVAHAAAGIVVPGNYNSGDQVPVMLNSGEVVLNRAQTQALAAQLTTGAAAGINLSATIAGEDIQLALNNRSRRTGRGEYVTSKKH